MQPITVRSLVCHRDIETALICLPSLVENAVEEVSLILHDDGTLTPEDSSALLSALPGARIVTTAEADAAVGGALERYPHARAFRARNVLGRKLLDVAVMGSGPLFFSDSDVFYLRPFRGMFAENGARAVFTTGEMEAYSLRPWHLAGANALKLPRRLNSGVMAVRGFDLDFIDFFLGRPELQDVFSKMPWWAEQTAWAALGSHLGCELWPAGQIAVMRPGLKVTDELVAIHFVTNIRYRLKAFANSAFRNGSSDDLQRFESEGGSSGGRPAPSAIVLRTEPMKRLRPWQLAATQLRLRSERFINDFGK